jgi:RNA polymerase sigma factor (sigma-70 family)
MNVDGDHAQRENRAMTPAQAGFLTQAAPQPTGTERVHVLTDQQLLARYVGQRDEAAFRGLLQRHARTVWGVCRRVLHLEQDVEDAFQAVFLVLARNAGSIRRGDAVGSWLHGVALRTALKARRNALRRQAEERQAAVPNPEPPPWSEAACRELQQRLDEEVQRLAEHYRAPFVLCCLEGLSKAEAARELGCKVGTVSGRLARARKLLQKRLARRGITLAGVLTASALVANAGAAAAPATLVQATADAVLAAPPGLSFSPSVAALADEVVRDLALTRSRPWFLVLAAGFLLLGATSLAVAFLKSYAEAGRASTVEPDTFLSPGVTLGTPIDEQVAAVAFSPDGRRLVTAGGRGQNPGQIKIWDAETARETAGVRQVPGVRALAFSPHGRTFATGDARGAVTLRDAATGDERASAPAHVGGVRGVAFSDDGASLASGGLDNTVRLWSGDRLQELGVCRGHTDAVVAVAFFHQGRAVVSASQDRSARIWDLTTGQAKLTLEGHQAGLEAVAVSPDDRLVATASRDETVRLWDAATGQERAVLPGGKGAVSHAVAFSPDGALLAGAGTDGIIRLWDTKTGQPAGTLEKHAAPVWSLAFSRQGILASGSADRTAKLWHLGGRKPATDLMTSWSGARPILAVAYAPDASVLAVATTDRTIHLRDAESGDVLRVLHGHTDHATCLAFSSDGKTLASGSKDGTVKLWDWATGDNQRTLTGPAQAVRTLTFTPDGRRLAGAGDDGTIRFWDVGSGNALATFPGHEGPIQALACTPDGRTLASGGADRTIKLWDLAYGEPRRAAPDELRGSEGAIRALAYSRDGLLASAGEDGAVKLWDPARGTATATLAGHAGPVLALAFTPRGRTLVSGGQDGSVRVWDPVGGQPRAVLAGHKDAVTALAIHPYGRDLVSGSQDTRLLRWRAGKIRVEDGPPGLKLPGADVARPEARADNLVVRAQDNPPEPPPSQVELYEDFRGARLPGPGFSMMGLDPDVTCQPEEGGLHITIPASQTRRPHAGLELNTLIKGNLEIIAGYEILHADHPTVGSGVGFELYVHTDTPTLERLGWFRVNRVNQGESYMVSRGRTEDGKNQYKNTCFPTAARSGRLKLTRRGTEVRSWAAEGAAGPFQELYQSELGAADVNKVWVAAYVGWSQHGVDLRLVDLKIRSGLADNEPALAPVSGVEVPAKAGRGGWLVWGGLVSLAIAGALLLRVGIGIARARRVR